MKSAIISFVFFLSASTLVSAGPVIAIGRTVASVVSAAMSGKKNKRDFFDDDYDLAVALGEDCLSDWVKTLS